MNKLASVSICLLLWSGFAVADPVLDEATIEGIRAEFSLAMENAEIDEELLSISIDAEKNEATLRERTVATMIIMGMKFQDASVSETTFGVVGGEIKVLISRDQLISSTPVQLIANQSDNECRQDGREWNQESLHVTSGVLNRTPNIVASTSVIIVCAAFRKPEPGSVANALDGTPICDRESRERMAVNCSLIDPLLVSVDQHHPIPL